MLHRYGSLGVFVFTARSVTDRWSAANELGFPEQQECFQCSLTEKKEAGMLMSSARNSK